jgi:hypothetical protein
MVSLSDELKKRNILKLIWMVRFGCATLDVGHPISMCQSSTDEDMIDLLFELNEESQEFWQKKIKNMSLWSWSNLIRIQMWQYRSSDFPKLDLPGISAERGISIAFNEQPAEHNSSGWVRWKADWNVVVSILASWKRKF